MANAAEDRLCGTCQAWMCLASDAWCGNCGAGVAQLSLEISPSVLEAKQVAPLVCFTITNHSCAELEIENRTATPKWLTIDIDSRLVAAPGETVRVWGEARSFDLQGPAVGEISFRTQAGVAEKPLLVVAETPTLAVSPSEIVFWSNTGSRRGAEGVRTQLSIFPEQGRLKILGARSELPRQLEVASLTVPVVASRQEPALIEVGVNDEQLLSKLWPPGLTVEYEGAHGSANVTIPLLVAIKQPPQLCWDGEDAEPAVRFYSDRQMVDVALSNRDPQGRDGGGGNADLIVTAVRLIPPAGFTGLIEQQSEKPHLGSQLTISGGATGVVRFQLDLTSVGNREGQYVTQAQLVHFDLEVQSNAGTLRRKLPLRVEPLRIFDGIVAIDFGSSNTCCAVVLPGERPVPLNLDEDRVVSPTVVRYLDLSKTPPQIEVGAKVKDLAAKSSEVAASTVSRLKQRLGAVRESLDVRPRSSEEWVTRRASEAAADYLREVRKLAEAQESAIFWDFILTHPARCPLRQYRRMREALREAFGHEGKRIEYLQEPIAALIPLFLERAEHTAPLDYTVASFDLGGGTTDVAVVHVRQTCTGDGDVEIEPEILFCHGVNFGGEDLTDYLERELRRRCVAELAREEPGSEVVSDEIRAPAKAEVLMNSAALRGAADALKASLSEEARSGEREDVALWTRRKDGTSEVGTFRVDRLVQEGGADLRHEFLEFVASRVSEMAGMLQIAGRPEIAIGTIQLSGKTAYLPVVGETIHRLFPEASVVRARDPKECVVRGACLARTMRAGRLRLKLPQATHRMTSSIGIWPSRTSPFIPVLRADADIPKTGADTTIPLAWDGEAIPIWENTGSDDDGPVALYERGLLTRLGSWRPELPQNSAPSDWTGLRLRLRELELEVLLVHRDGSETLCLPTHGGIQ